MCFVTNGKRTQNASLLGPGCAISRVAHTEHRWHAKDPMSAHYIRSIRIDDLGKRRISSKNVATLLQRASDTRIQWCCARDVGNRTNIRVLVMKHFVWIFRQDSICYYKTYSLSPLLSSLLQKAHTNAFCGSFIHHPNLYKYIMFLFNFPGVS